jgi:gliding motility-associated-like protein
MKNFNKSLILFCLTFFLNVSESKAQIDTVFWFAAPWVTPDHHWRDPIKFHFSTFANPTEVRLRMPATGYDTTINIPANSLFSKSVDFMINTIESKPANTVLNSGFQITSNEPITVVYDVITRAPNYYNPETYSLKGQNGLGKEFIAPFQTRWNNQNLNTDINSDGLITQPYQQINIVASEDNTVLYITPRCAVVGHPANVTFTITLPLKGNVYTVQNMVQNTNVVGNNLAGSIIVSTKPISVTVSDDSVNPSGGGGCYDLMGDQIVPTDVIGKEYIVLKGFLNAGSEESVFVTATENFTTISINDGTITSVILNQGDTYRYQITQSKTHVVSDKSVYLLHMTGYGCELGSDILPPLNCAGSDIVTFPRTNPQNFSLNILCPTAITSSFQLNGSAAPVPAASFTTVPGTSGAWSAAQITLNTTLIPSNSSNILTNSAGNFALGIINGGTSTGCLYHYMSSFIKRVYVNAGNDLTLCNNITSIPLTGSVTGGASTGQWSVLNGSGTLNNPTSLIASYEPVPSDFSQGFVKLLLVSTGLCEPVFDTITISFIQAPLVNAGLDETFCKNNYGAITLSGSLIFASGASWTGGNGGSFANNGNLNTNYIPSQADLNADSITLILTSSGSFNLCPNASDTVKIYFTEAPIVQAGADVVVCTNESEINLNGVVSGITNTGTWSTIGYGSFSPSQDNLISTYNFSLNDTTIQSLYLTLTSTNNGNCLAVMDSLKVTIIEQPTVSILSSPTTCSSASLITLTGTVTAGFSSLWTENGSNSVVSPSSLNTFYSISPNDISLGYIDFYLSTTSLCPLQADTMRIFILPPPHLIAGLDQTICANTPIELVGVVAISNPIVSWVSLGTGTFSPNNNLLNTYYIPSATDIANGSVDLILYADGNVNCSPEPDTLQITFKPSPTADFSITDICQGAPINFTNTSTTPVGSIDSWAWDFGDFTNSSLENPTHIYEGNGIYSPLLVVTASNGCVDSVIIDVFVDPIPIADFNFTLPCENALVDFYDQSFISSGSIIAWNYHFEDTITSNLPNPSHDFSQAGIFPVTLTVTTFAGCQDTVTIDLDVKPKPIAGFIMTPNPVVVEEDVVFADTSIGTGINYWLWNFGDGTIDNNQNPSHSFTDGGFTEIVLIITDEFNCSDTAKASIEVALTPSIPTGFSPNGDGINDVLYIDGGPFNSVDFKIFNNWGQIVFSCTDASIGWDGMFRDIAVPLGVYTWVLTVEMKNGEQLTKSGDVTIIQ